MTDDNNSLYLSRILSGYYYFILNNQKYKLVYPDISIRYQAEIYADEEKDSNKYNEWLTDEDIIDYLISHGMWSHDGDSKLKDIENGLNLGGWLSSQKYQKNIGKLSSDRIQKLEEIGVIWSIVRNTNKNKISKEFEKKFNLLLKFKEREGHCAVPYAHLEEGTKLGHWINNLRSLKSNLGLEVISKLDQIGFVWSVKKKAFD